MQAELFFQHAKLKLAFKKPSKTTKAALFALKIPRGGKEKSIGLNLQCWLPKI